MCHLRRMKDAQSAKVRRTVKRVTSLSAEEAANLDAYARSHYLNSSAVIRQAVLAFVGAALPCPWFPSTPEEFAAAAKLAAMPVVG